MKRMLAAAAVWTGWVLLAPGCADRGATSAQKDETGSVEEAVGLICEDRCLECFLHCPSETRFECRTGTGCFNPKPVQCICCKDNECLHGSPTTGFCVACPSGQVCDDTSNSCCTPIPPAKACGGRTCGTASDGCGRTINCGTCASGQVCNAGSCCTPTGCPNLGAGDACGALSNGCGGTNNCTFCGTQAACVNGVCQCNTGYRNCGGICTRNDLPCQ